MGRVCIYCINYVFFVTGAIQQGGLISITVITLFIHYFTVILRIPARMVDVYVYVCDIYDSIDIVYINVYMLYVTSLAIQQY